MIQRNFYLDKLKRNMWNVEIKVITGIRRCGKSVLLFDLFYEYLLSQDVSEDHILKVELTSVNIINTAIPSHYVNM